MNKKLLLENLRNVPDYPKKGHPISRCVHPIQKPCLH